MAQETINEQLQRALFFCQMFNFGFGRAGLWGLHDPVAEGFTTFADAHLLFTMFLVDKGTNHWADLFIHFFMERGKRNG